MDDVTISNKNENNLDAISVLLDDLNTPGLITELNNIVKEYNSPNSNKENLKSRLSVISSVLGILEDKTFKEIPEELKNKINDMILKRSEAKNNKDFKTADAIRDQLIELGVEINDSSDGTQWNLKS